MAGWIGLTAANEIYNFLYRGQAISIGGSLYLRLLVAPSSRSGGGAETNYSGYTRLESLRSTSGLFGVTAGGLIANSSALEFPTANSLGNGNFVWFDFVDTPSGAFTKLYNGGPINPTKVVVVGKPPKFRAGAMILTM
jgi:hypothetical protein